MMSTHTIIRHGESRSFPDEHPFLSDAQDDTEIVVHIGQSAGKGFKADSSKRAILIELGTECLGVHTGEDRGHEGSNVLGFARFRIGDDAPSDLVELVTQPETNPDAISAAQEIFSNAGFEVAVCKDFSGRILDRLLRPYFNETLRRLDDGLATAEDMDLTLKLGLGYPEGPIGLLTRTGLAHHHDVTKSLFDVYGTQAFAPARRAVVAKMRSESKS